MRLKGRHFCVAETVVRVPSNGLVVSRRGRSAEAPAWLRRRHAARPPSRTSEKPSPQEVARKLRPQHQLPMSMPLLELAVCVPHINEGEDSGNGHVQLAPGDEVRQLRDDGRARRIRAAG